jgi:hypothetical protein
LFLAFQNPIDDLPAEEDELARIARAEMRQALRDVLLADGPDGTAEESRDLGNIQGLAQGFGGVAIRYSVREHSIYCSIFERVA